MSLNKTAIKWTDFTWNAWSGCRKISPGCLHCYAHTLAEKYRGTPAFPNGFDLTIRGDKKLRAPLHLKTPSMIFADSMSDFFLEDHEFGLQPGTMDQQRDRCLDIIEQTPQHEYQILTKRPTAMLEYSRRRKLPPNFWAGISLDVQEQTERLDILRQVDAGIRFVSAEPILTPLTNLDLSGISGVVAGGESGGHLMDAATRQRRALVDYDDKTHQWTPRTDRADWARDLRDQCIRQGVSFLWKQWGGYKPHSAGRLLDGVEWNDLPRYPGGSQCQ